MGEKMNRPFEVDLSEYPFKDHWLPYQDGHVHYIDEGQGPTVLLLHGNPTWSYLYRNVIKELSSECRLIALDYPRLGMSKAPFDYRVTPQEHAQVVQDWGGPIGFNYAVGHRENLRGIVLMNTWAWPAILPMRLFSLAMGGWPFGYWLQTQRNFFAKTILPSGIHHSEKVTESLRKAYTDPFPTPKSRIPTWVFPRQIRKSRWMFLHNASKRWNKEFSFYASTKMERLTASRFLKIWIYYPYCDKYADCLPPVCLA
jgi:haloalkane dehalogenase